MSGAGAGAGTVSTVSAAGRANADGISMFNVKFFVERPQFYDFDGAFVSSGELVDTGLVAFGEWSAQLWRLERGQTVETAHRIFDHVSRESGSVRERGVLLVGSHILQVTAFGGALGLPGRGTGSASFRFTMDLEPASNATPEPASLVLLGSGLVGWLGIRRRRRGQES